jgi:hypothetical protein
MKLTVNQWITINQQKAWNYVVLCKFNKKKALVLCLISISSYSFVNYLEQGFLPANWDFFFFNNANECFICILHQSYKGQQSCLHQSYVNC